MAARFRPCNRGPPTRRQARSSGSRSGRPARPALASAFARGFEESMISPASLRSSGRRTFRFASSDAVTGSVETACTSRHPLRSSPWPVMTRKPISLRRGQPRRLRPRADHRSASSLETARHRSPERREARRLPSGDLGAAVARPWGRANSVPDPVSASFSGETSSAGSTLAPRIRPSSGSVPATAGFALAFLKGAAAHAARLKPPSSRPPCPPRTAGSRPGGRPPAGRRRRDRRR